MMRNNINVFKIKLVKEEIEGEYNTRIQSPSDVVKVVRKFIENFSDREVFVVVCLSTKNDIAGINIVSVGTLNSSLVHPREVFKPSLLSNTARLIVAHNHPSGDLEPSKEDIEITNRLAKAGEIMGIEVLDHLIIGDGYLSMKERNLF